MIGEFLLFGRKMVAPVEPLVTLCHGDYLRNNVAFKYADVNMNKPREYTGILFVFQCSYRALKIQ